MYTFFHARLSTYDTAQPAFLASDQDERSVLQAQVQAGTHQILITKPNSTTIHNTTANSKPSLCTSKWGSLMFTVPTFQVAYPIFSTITNMLIPPPTTAQFVISRTILLRSTSPSKEFEKRGITAWVRPCRPYSSDAALAVDTSP